MVVRPGGAKLWQVRYRLGAKEKTFSLGSYPETGLAEARQRRDDAMAKVRAGLDPVAERRAARRISVAAETTFEGVARQWLARNAGRWVPDYVRAVTSQLERDVFPAIGAKEIKSLAPPDVLAVLQKIEDSGRGRQARTMKWRCSQIFQFGCATGACQADPTAVIRGQLRAVPINNHPAITEIEPLRAALAATCDTPASPLTRLALRFVVLTAARTKEVRHATWSQFANLDNGLATWTIPASVMKMRRPHVVPLSRQAVALLEVARRFSGRSALVFPGRRSRDAPLSETALSDLVLRAGLVTRQSVHGFRASFSSIMNDLYPADRAAIDAALAHVSGRGVEAVYNRAIHLHRRRELMQCWADHVLEGAPPPDELVARRRRRIAVAKATGPA